VLQHEGKQGERTEQLRVSMIKCRKNFEGLKELIMVSRKKVSYVEKGKTRLRNQVKGLVMEGQVECALVGASDAVVSSCALLPPAPVVLARLASLS